MLKIDEVKEFLRLDTDAEDGYISILIILAKEMCENYLRKEIPSEPIESIKQAQLLIVGHFYEYRDGTPVPKAVYRLLDAYRNEVF